MDAHCFERKPPIGTPLHCSYTHGPTWTHVWPRARSVMVITSSQRWSVAPWDGLKLFLANQKCSLRLFCVTTPNVKECSCSSWATAPRKSFTAENKSAVSNPLSQSRTTASSACAFCLYIQRHGWAAQLTTRRQHACEGLIQTRPTPLWKHLVLILMYMYGGCHFCQRLREANGWRCGGSRCSCCAL